MKFNQFNNPSSGYDGFFELADDYIFFNYLVLDKEGEELPTENKIKICSPLSFVGRSRYQGKFHGIIISFADPDGIEKVFRILFSELQSDGLSVRQSLSSEGLYINPVRLARKLFNDFLLTATPPSVFEHKSLYATPDSPIIFIGSEIEQNDDFERV